MPSNTSPRASDMSIEDDWTKVKDPKQKKRIQNRVAQRTYRHRMKARLGELQARLDNHEKNTTPLPRNCSPSSMDSTIGSMALGTVDVSLLLPRIPLHSSPSSTSPSLPEVMPLMENSPSPMTLSIDSVEGTMPHIPSLYDRPVDLTDPDLFTDAHLLNTPPHSMQSPPDSGLGSRKMSQDLMMDCVQFQSRLITRLNDLHGPSRTIPCGSQGVAPMMEHVNLADSANSYMASSDTTRDPLDFGAFNTASYCEPWQGPSPANEPSLSLMPHTMAPAIRRNTPPAVRGISSVQPGHSIDQGLAGASDYVEQLLEGDVQPVAYAGVDNFDAMIAAYDGDNPGNYSSIPDEQYSIID